MKRSELKEFIGANLSRDDIRKKLFSLGLGEFNEELEMDSAWVDAHGDISYIKEYSLGQHSHLFMEILYCVQGDVEYLLNTRTVHVTAGDILIIPPGVIHAPILPEELEVPYERYVLWLSPIFLENLDRNMEFSVCKLPQKIEIREERWGYIKDLFYEAVMETERQEIGWQTNLIGYGLHILVHLTRLLENTKTEAVTGNKMLQEEILDYIQKNLSQKLSVKETARHFHMSESSLTHLFHKRIGVSFYKCVTQRRLAEAKNLIAKDIPMEQISQKVGFPEYSAFYRAFKAEYGISPSQYKQFIGNLS